MANVLHLYKLTRFSNHRVRLNIPVFSFTPLQTYKVLKHVMDQSYHDLLFYTSTNLQGSQTKDQIKEAAKRFYTSTNLQGSQTSN